MTRELLRDSRSIVVKVGSSQLASVRGGIDREFVTALVAELAALRRDGREVVLVSSGAVAAGTAELGLPRRPADMPLIQAAAAVGQAALMEIYRATFGTHGLKVGQVLLTRDGLKDRQRFLHARNTLRALIDSGVVPVVNENDTVAIEELKLKMGDNDGLAVSVSQLVGADCLVILTDVPGLYDRSPSEEGAELISHVKEITPAMLSAAGGSGSDVGSGGMGTKLTAALAASVAGIPLVVAPGKRSNVLQAVFAGEEVGTFFSPRARRANSRLQWIAFGRPPDGAVVVDAGAVKALVEKKTSLLAIGVREIRGEFGEGDTIGVIGPDGLEIARGLSNFASSELATIAGRRGEEHAALLGYDCAGTVVHRDNLVVLR